MNVFIFLWWLDPDDPNPADCDDQNPADPDDHNPADPCDSDWQN